MQKIMEGIADILGMELGIYRDLIQISNMLTDVILNEDIKKLEEVLNVQQTMIMTLGKLEKDRLRAMDELWSDNLFLTDLIDKAEGGLAVRLKGLLEDLTEVVEEQKRLNHINGKLIKNNLEYIDMTLKTLTGNKPVNLFDQKA